MSNVTNFNFRGADVRTIVLPNGEPGFVGKDVAERLGYKDPTTAIRSHCRGVVVYHPIPDALGRMQRVRVLSVDDAVALVVNSRLPGADDFAQSLFSAVGLPAVAFKNKRDEIAFGEEVVNRLFSGYAIIPQFSVMGGRYRIDWYVPELRLAIEFDERHHTSGEMARADAVRQAEIEKELGCRFLRYRK